MILSKFKDITTVVLDVDGVMTDGSVLVNEEGEQLRSFNVRDGYAMQLAVKSGIQVWVITGGKSSGVEKRMYMLGASEVHLAVEDKQSLLMDLATKYARPMRDMMYVGDDIPDVGCLEIVGLPVCPSDAVEEVKGVCRYISPYAGGHGVVRDVLEKILKLQGKWTQHQVLKSV